MQEQEFVKLLKKSIKKHIRSCGDPQNLLLKEIANFMNKSNISFKINRGMYKTCYSPNGCDFVIKATNDTCDIFQLYEEHKLYNKSLKNSASKIFPITHIYKIMINEKWTYFLIQEKITYLFRDIDNNEQLLYKLNKIGKTVPSRKVKRFLLDYYYILDDLFIKLIISLYGVKASKEIVDFLNKYQIRDLHGENIGIKNNKPYIIDFSI